MKHDFRGRTVEIVWKDKVLVPDKRGRLRRHAAACQVDDPPFTIELDNRLQVKKVEDMTRAHVVLHEGLHQCFPDMREKVITAAADSLYIFLLRQGVLKEGQ